MGFISQLIIGGHHPVAICSHKNGEVRVLNQFWTIGVKYPIPPIQPKLQQTHLAQLEWKELKPVSHQPNSPLPSAAHESLHAKMKNDMAMGQNHVLPFDRLMDGYSPSHNHSFWHIPVTSHMLSISNMVGVLTPVLPCVVPGPSIQCYAPQMATRQKRTKRTVLEGVGSDGIETRLQWIFRGSYWSSYLSIL